MTIEKLLKEAREHGEYLIPSSLDEVREGLKYAHGGWQGDAFWEFKDLLKNNEENKTKTVDAIIEGMKKWLDSPSAQEAVYDFVNYTDFSTLDEEDEDDEDSDEEEPEEEEEV